MEKNARKLDFNRIFLCDLERSFQVGKYLELRFEFRTSEVNGVILSVAEPVGFPAISIELHKGKVRLNTKITFSHCSEIFSKFYFFEQKKIEKKIEEKNLNLLY